MEELREYRRLCTKAEIDKSVSTLTGILEGIAIDGSINARELTEFLNWCELHREFEHRHPFNELFHVIDKVMDDGIITEEEVHDILYVCRNMDPESVFYRLITAGIQELQGILHGIIADSEINDAEILGLERWMSDNDYLRGSYPFSEIDSLLTAVLSDHCIDMDEKEMLLAYFSNFVDLRQSAELDPLSLQELRSKYRVGGICAASPEVIIPDHWFCFTGESSRAPRREIAERIIGRGGIFKNSVSGKTQYLVVGDEGNPCWAFASYGRKVEEAMFLRQSGSPIQIIHEADFWDALVE